MCTVQMEWMMWVAVSNRVLELLDMPMRYFNLGAQWIRQKTCQKWLNTNLYCLLSVCIGQSKTDIVRRIYDDCWAIALTLSCCSCVLCCFCIVLFYSAFGHNKLVIGFWVINMIFGENCSFTITVEVMDVMNINF